MANKGHSGRPSTGASVSPSKLNAQSCSLEKGFGADDPCLTVSEARTWLWNAAAQICVVDRNGYVRWGSRNVHKKLTAPWSMHAEGFWKSKMVASSERTRYEGSMRQGDFADMRPEREDWYGFACVHTLLCHAVTFDFWHYLCAHAKGSN